MDQKKLSAHVYIFTRRGCSRCVPFVAVRMRNLRRMENFVLNNHPPPDSRSKLGILQKHEGDWREVHVFTLKHFYGNWLDERWELVWIFDVLCPFIFASPFFCVYVEKTCPVVWTYSSCVAVH